MAIAKMKKLTLVANNHHKDEMLRLIQSLENFEVYNLNQEDLESDSSIFSVNYDNKRYRDLETQFERVQDQLQFINQYLPQLSMIKNMRKKPLEMTLDELEQNVDEQLVEKNLQLIAQKRQRLQEIEGRNSELNQYEETARRWQNLNFHPNDLKQMSHMSYFLGTIPQSADNRFIQMFDESPFVYAYEVFQDKDDIGLVLLFETEQEGEVQKVMREAHFSSFQYPFKVSPKHRLEEVLKERETINKERETIENELKNSEGIKHSLILAESYYYNILQREGVKSLMKDTKHLFATEGWLEADEFNRVKEQLERHFNSNEYVIVSRNVQEEEVNDVPIVLKNNSFFEPFEVFTEMYALPKYNELDPTPLLAPFYCVFFGMMAADFGYGLLLFLATLFALKVFHLKPSLRKNIKLFHILSYPTMIWGVIFGSFFGFVMPGRLLATDTDVNTILMISVGLGVIQIFFGLLIATHLKVKAKDYTGLVSDALGWIGLLSGLGVWGVGAALLNSDLISSVGKYTALISAILIVLASVMGNKNRAIGFASGLYNLYGISGYVSDLVSYTRLMALSVSGASIATAFNSIIMLLPLPFRLTFGILLFIMLHSLNIFLTYLSAYVHDIRLQFVEFFSKFYEGGGRAFKPLKMYEKDIRLKQNK
ncbi:V-type ATP synthase subunit I [Atopobacter phocae]|uniref:V-type ATP synthase subunit I n=1 Tax=Atopobacter phocae TaxID=136492 RepID=UPI0004723C38|nr:V-type ATP synthase subunit I [Atopobacter phocae]